MVNNLLIRSSCAGKIMTDPRTKSEDISETCKAYLIELFIKLKYQRTREFTNKYVSKGLSQEPESVTLYSRFAKNFFQKNEANFKNEFISGTPDIIKNDTVYDCKTSWNIFTYYEAISKPINKDYLWQLQCYMALTGCAKSKLVYCLVNTPQHLIDDEKRFLSYKLQGEELQKGFDEIDRLSFYDDIPVSERIFEISVERDNDAIKRIYDRVQLCRSWMQDNLTF